MTFSSLPKLLVPGLSVAVMFGLFLGWAAHAVAAGGDADGGLQPGDPLGAFRVIKVAGAPDDGFEPGDDLCYRCRYGSSPMVMVFARTDSPGLTELVKRIESRVAGGKLRGLVTVFGGELEELKKRASRIAKQSGVKLVPVVVARDTKTGPFEYRLSPSAEVTVVVARESQVVAVEVFAAESVSSDAVMKHVTEMLSQ